MSRPEVLFVDDDARAGELAQRFCAGRPFQLTVFRDPLAALDRFRAGGADLVVTDLKMPGLTGLELLRELRGIDSEVPVVMITAYASVDSAVEALRLGAVDFLKKPYDMEELVRLVERNLEHRQLRDENRQLRRELGAVRRVRGLIGASAPMDGVRQLLKRIAAVRCHVVLSGESGTGKELAARAIHDQGPDVDRPFIVIDCGALSDTLLESELFGHEKGAFTGAQQTKRGLFEIAHGGTVLLDEIGHVSAAMQAKLLRVVQEQQLTRVGGLRPIDIDVRCIAASHRDLGELVAEGEFRNDLYHRLNVLQLRMPALRDHPEDIPLLVRHFIEAFNARHGTALEGFGVEALSRLQQRAWPGNVRELLNLVERHCALADGPLLQLDDTPTLAAPSTGGSDIDRDWPTLAELEERYIERVLDDCDGNRRAAAERLGIDKTTLWRRLRRDRPA